MLKQQIIYSSQTSLHHTVGLFCSSGCSTVKADATKQELILEACINKLYSTGFVLYE